MSVIEQFMGYFYRDVDNFDWWLSCQKLPLIYILKENKFTFINNNTHVKSYTANVFKNGLDILHNKLLRFHLHLILALFQRKTRADMLV
jgi:hypothetical protein